MKMTRHTTMALALAAMVIAWLPTAALGLQEPVPAARKTPLKGKNTRQREASPARKAEPDETFDDDQGAIDEPLFDGVPDAARPVRPQGDRPGPENAPNRPGPNWQRLSPDEKVEVENFIADHFPRIHQELFDEHPNPRLFERRMRRMLPEMLRLMDLNQRSPEIAALTIEERRLDMEHRALVLEYHNATNPEAREEIRRKVADSLRALFEARHERRKAEIATLERKLDMLKRQMQRMEERRDGFIREKLEQELREPSGTQQDGRRSKRPSEDPVEKD